jgi:hypothetical protein
VDRLPRVILTASVALAAAPAVLGGRWLAIDLFERSHGMSPVHIGTLIATFVAFGSTGHVWQYPERSLEGWFKLAMLTVLLGVSAFWFSGTLYAEEFHPLKPLGMAFTGLFFGGPILVPLALSIAGLFVALVHFGRAEKGEVVRPVRLLVGFGVYATLNIGLATAIVWQW